jgi:hypothetical protein
MGRASCGDETSFTPKLRSLIDARRPRKLETDEAAVAASQRT